MPAPKSILQSIKVDCAGASHNCQRSKHHRVSKGDRRLKVRKDRSHEHFCVACAIEFIERDIETLRLIVQQLKGEIDLPISEAEEPD